MIDSLESVQEIKIISDNKQKTPKRKTRPKTKCVSCLNQFVDIHLSKSKQVLTRVKNILEDEMKALDSAHPVDMVMATNETYLKNKKGSLHCY